MKYDERACKFNMDTGCVELLLRDGRMISIDCTGVDKLDHQWRNKSKAAGNVASLYLWDVLLRDCKKNELFHFRSTMEFSGDDHQGRIQLQRGSDRSRTGEQTDRYYTEIKK